VDFLEMHKLDRARPEQIPAILGIAPHEICQSTAMVTRKHPRFPVSLSSTLLHKNQFRHAGSVRNLSAKGCCVDSIVSPFTGMQLTMELHIPGDPQPILIENAAVRWSGSAGIGLEFLTIASPHQDRLNRMVQQLQPKTGS
jgi:hypothetical protein